MPSSPSLKRILIIQTAFLGDVILATGIVHKLRLTYSNAKIDFLLKKENAHVLQGHPDIDNLILFDKSTKWKELWRLIKIIRKEKYDLVVNLHRFASSGILATLSNATITVGFDKNPLSTFYTTSVPHVLGSRANPFHEIQRNHSLITDFVDDIPEKPFLQITPEVLQKTREYRQGSYVCIAPTSVWYTKQLPEEKWAALIRKIPETTTIYLLGGTTDHDKCERIKNNARRNNVKILAGKLSIQASAAVMKEAVLNFVNDSAPTHLASAVDGAVCTVYCSTVPDFGFGPLSSFSRIVETTEVLSCRPCNLHGYKNCPLTHFKCATTIEVDTMYKYYLEAMEYKNLK